MVLPLAVPLAIMAGSAVVGAGANMYSQAKQRELYRYQRGGYERYIENWHKAFPGRTMRYPEFEAPGKIRALDTGISQSYASSLGSGARLAGTLAGGTLYGGRIAHSLYGKSVGHSSRYL